jgi:putative solute:sodium symporter small subunit
MQLSNRQRAYWRRTLRMTALLLLVWFTVTFVPVWFARSLSEVRIFGWPLAFYMVAQGCLIVYVLIVWIYYRRMQQFDIDGGVEEGEA